MYIILIIWFYSHNCISDVDNGRLPNSRHGCERTQGSLLEYRVQCNHCMDSGVSDCKTRLSSTLQKRQFYLHRLDEKHFRWYCSVQLDRMVREFQFQWSALLERHRSNDWLGSPAMLSRPMVLTWSHGVVYQWGVSLDCVTSRDPHHWTLLILHRRCRHTDDVLSSRSISRQLAAVICTTLT